MLEIQVRLADIIANHQHRLKAATNDDLNRLAALLKGDPLSIPPIVVYLIGPNHYGLIGGYARVEAAQRAGLQTLKAVVTDPPRNEDDALLK